MESAGRCLQNTKGGVREGLMEEAAFERNLKDVLGSGWHGVASGRRLFQAENEHSQRHRAVRTACPRSPL